MAHDEFPPLTEDAELVLRDAEHDLNLGGQNWRRCYLAAGLREAMKQASPDSRGSCKWDRLGAIADNLHALPPPPPTREEMESALNEVVGIFVKNLEYKRNSPIEGYVQTIKRGIAHYFKEQP